MPPDVAFQRVSSGNREAPGHLVLLPQHGGGIYQVSQWTNLLKQSSILLNNRGFQNCKT